MTYNDFIDTLLNLTVLIDDNTGKWYLSPDYRHLISLSDIDITMVDDFDDISWDIVFENLKMEVDMYNDRRDPGNNVMKWMNDIITGVILPEKDNMQNEYLKDVIEYLKQKKSDEQKQTKTRTKKATTKTEKSE